MAESPDLRRQPLAPLRPFALPRLHDDAALDGYLEAALGILERTGVRVLSERALAVFAEHGATAELHTGVVRLPADLVRGALASAPRTFVLGSRDGSCDLDLASGDTFMTTDGSDVEVIDWRSGERRATTKADLADATRVQDYLGSIGFWWPTVAAGDCGRTAQLHELEVAWNGTVKHAQGMVQGQREARVAVEMARVVAGGEGELRRRPPLSDLISVVSPLTIDRDGADAALVFAEAGVPVAVVSWPACGTTAPATAAGATAQGLAEVAAMATLLQLAHPGAPVIGYLLVVTTDPRTGAIVTCPFGDRDPTLVVDLVHRLGLPCLAAFAGTDDERTGTWRAAAESSHSLMTAAWSGAELTVGLGGTNGSILWSFTELLLDDHLYHQARYAVSAIPTDDERLALDVIHAVGPGGHFLGHSHTRRHLREEFRRGLTLVAADAGGYRDAVEVARERAIEILEHYVPEGLEADKAAALRELVAAADADLG
jgi:trimethylamine--corrinoid protein Co-methyltransferase